MTHPRLSCYSVESLAYRSIALCRIAQILDSLLYLVSGPSVLAEQSFSPSRYQLESFTESSFTSSRLYLEAGVTQSPIPKRKEKVLESERKGIVEDDFAKEGNNHLIEANLKRLKPSPASIEKCEEQLKAVKRKVYNSVLLPRFNTYVKKQTIQGLKGAP